MSTPAFSLSEKIPFRFTITMESIRRLPWAGFRLSRISAFLRPLILCLGLSGFVGFQFCAWVQPIKPDKANSNQGESPPVGSNLGITRGLSYNWIFLITIFASGGIYWYIYSTKIVRLRRSSKKALYAELLTAELSESNKGGLSYNRGLS